jgi:hypothetical protein
MDNFILTETAYRAHSLVPNHSHSNPNSCKVLQGSFTETFDSGTRESDTNMATRWHFTHDTRFIQSAITSTFQARVVQACTVTEKTAPQFRVLCERVGG